MKYILVTLVLIVGMFGAAFGECTSADKAALEAFDREWGMAGEKGDRAALMNMLADEFVGLPFMVTKTMSIETTMKNFEANKNDPNPDKTTHDHYFINCTPMSATITHRNVIWSAEGPDGKPGTFYTRSVHQLEKRGGKWVAVSNAGGGLMDDYATLWYLEQDWNNAGVTKNKDWMEKTFASDYSSVGSRDGKLYTKAQDIADTMDSKNVQDFAETTDMNIRVDGNAAIITGIFHSKGKNAKGEAYDRRIRFTDSWIKRDGRWQAWSTSGSEIK